MYRQAEASFYAVYSAMQEISYGKVTSYGHIAKLVGTCMCTSSLSQARGDLF
jgi:alkylated DNA nucleotide flippase Atl1